MRAAEGSVRDQDFAFAPADPNDVAEHVDDRAFAFRSNADERGEESRGAQAIASLAQARAVGVLFEERLASIERGASFAAGDERFDPACAAPEIARRSLTGDVVVQHLLEFVDSARRDESARATILVAGEAERFRGRLGIAERLELLGSLAEVVSKRRGEGGYLGELDANERTFLSCDVALRKVLGAKLDRTAEENESRFRIELGIAARDQYARRLVGPAGVRPELDGASEVPLELRALRRADLLAPSSEEPGEDIKGTHDPILATPAKLLRPGPGARTENAQSPDR
jgi:hypothetical protein